MAPLDDKIDQLYQLTLAEFTVARNALAKTLSGDEARRVKTLPKPTVVPWAINQVYWRARPVYERLLKSGTALREAQLAALEGRAPAKPKLEEGTGERRLDVRRASETHRKGLADAVEHAARLAKAHGSRPDVDQLSRMLEAVSMAATRPDTPGRLTELVQPAGFEALTGVTPVGPTAFAKASAVRRSSPEMRRERRRKRPGLRDYEAERARKEAEAQQARVQAQIQIAERALERARTAEARARRDYERAQQEVRAAEQALARLKT